MTRTFRLALTGTVGLVLAAAATAQVPMPGFVVPVVAKIKGVGTSVWQSNLSISNVSDFDVRVSAHFFKEKQSNTFDGTFAKSNVLIRKGETLEVTDVIGTWFPSAGSNTKGWVLIGETSDPVCPQPEEPPMPKLVVNSRLYNAANPLALFGQTIEAQWTTLNPTTSPSIMTGILHQGKGAIPGSRTNVGVVNPSTVPIVVRIKLFRANGTVAGDITRTVEALSLRQWSLDTELGFPVLNTGAGRLEVTLVDPDFDPCADIDEPPEVVCTDPCAPECTELVSFPEIKMFFTYAANADNGSGDGENLLPVIDYLAFSDYIDAYREQHCPSVEDASVLQTLVMRYGLDRVRPRATFRKLPRVEK